MHLQYRADIDGLRAIAVLAVIFFHANIPGFTGGYVGVDIFFVISGFLITSIILKEIQKNRFFLSRFYERRIRRIFPAIVPMIIFTLAFGAFLLDANAYKDLGQSITATSLFMSNILFFHRSGYFDISSLQKPLLHTWSLAVEEQFYIFFPALLIAINKFLKKKYFLCLSIIFLCSLITSIWGVHEYQQATFYLLPTRAWELLSGALLSLDEIPYLKNDYLKNFISISGLCLIFYSIFNYTESTLFPGFNAIIPVFGTSLIIYSGIGGSSIINKILSFKPFVSIGLISYSLYLWHWPIIAFAKYILLRNLNLFEAAEIISVTFIISSLSLKFVEQPFRGKNPLIRDKWKLFAIAGIVILVPAISGVIIHVQRGMPFRNHLADENALNVNDDPQWIDFEKNANRLDDGATPLIIGKKNTTPTFLLWGDSHANALLTALAEKSNSLGKSGYIMIRPSCLPLIGMEQVPSNNEAANNQSVIDFIKKHPEIHTVIIAGYWSQQRSLIDITCEFPGKKSYDFLLKLGLLRSVNSLLNLEKKVVIVSDIPVLKGDPYRIYWLASRFGKIPDFHKVSISKNEYLRTNKDIIPFFNKLAKKKNVTIIHPETILFDKSGTGIVMRNNKVLYVDADHLSSIGSRFIEPIFNNILK